LILLSLSFVLLVFGGCVFDKWFLFIKDLVLFSLLMKRPAFAALRRGKPAWAALHEGLHGLGVVGGCGVPVERRLRNRCN
jgi:hypothetical protein